MFAKMSALNQQALSREVLDGSSAITDTGARLDVAACGVWGWVFEDLEACI